MKYRKKPVIIEAFQWFPEMGAVGGLAFDHYKNAMRPKGTSDLYCYRIQTLEGWLNVSPGDWIITGIKGEHYPCKPDIFEETYEAVE